MISHNWPSVSKLDKNLIKEKTVEWRTSVGLFKSMATKLTKEHEEQMNDEMANKLDDLFNEPVPEFGAPKSPPKPPKTPERDEESVNALNTGKGLEIFENHQIRVLIMKLLNLDPLFSFQSNETRRTNYAKYWPETEQIGSQE